MAGTDRKRELITGGPAIILVEPQLGENIGMVARAMANFGLSRLRLVNPRGGWPDERARIFAAGADRVLAEPGDEPVATPLGQLVGAVALLFLGALAMPAAEVTACCSAMPTSNVRSG